MMTNSSSEGTNDAAIAGAAAGGQGDSTSMSVNWVPAEEGLRQIIELLKESQSPDTMTQRVVQQVSDRDSGDIFDMSC
jgi:cation transport ATPase